MIITSCRPVSWNTLKASADTFSIEAKVLIAVCRQYELALVVKQGVRPSHVRPEENEIQYTLHEDFARLQGLGIRHVSIAKCDICHLIESVKRLARSQYSTQCSDFIIRTQGSEEERARYDLASSCEKYVKSVGTLGNEQILMRMVRAGAVLRVVQALYIAKQQHKSTILATHKGHGPADDYEEVPLQVMLRRSRDRMARVCGAHLRFV